MLDSMFPVTKSVFGLRQRGVNLSDITDFLIKKYGVEYILKKDQVAVPMWDGPITVLIVNNEKTIGVYIKHLAVYGMPEVIIGTQSHISWDELYHSFQESRLLV